MGYMHSDLVYHKNFQKAIHPDDLETYDHHWKKTLKGNSPSNTNYRLLSMNGEYHQLSEQITILDYSENGSPKNLLILIKKASS